ncbi:uncharacterized protein N7498_000570 [Penicillium cinerascens]|uniref:Uncharacterized protein n=1 Tax=Penicillium cinerascens TaxID=70096 RepID=A0A9W9NEQ4_9EURO|nr:uncharacterized protein N7498_000570 [Penicillium cinerascens]KAJ5218471.1 hypothetical protein N7498_000570 [Penicillium cinerascens]
MTVAQSRTLLGNPGHLFVLTVSGRSHSRAGTVGVTIEIGKKSLSALRIDIVTGQADRTAFHCWR